MENRICVENCYLKVLNNTKEFLKIYDDKLYTVEIFGL